MFAYKFRNWQNKIKLDLSVDNIEHVNNDTRAIYPRGEEPFLLIKDKNMRDMEHSLDNPKTRDEIIAAINTHLIPYKKFGVYKINPKNSIYPPKLDINIGDKESLNNTEKLQPYSELNINEGAEPQISTSLHKFMPEVVAHFLATQIKIMGQRGEENKPDLLHQAHDYYKDLHGDDYHDKLYEDLNDHILNKHREWLKKPNKDLIHQYLHDEPSEKEELLTDLVKHFFTQANK